MIKSKVLFSVNVHPNANANPSTKPYSIPNPNRIPMGGQ